MLAHSLCDHCGRLESCEMRLDATGYWSCVDCSSLSCTHFDYVQAGKRYLPEVEYKAGDSILIQNIASVGVVLFVAQSGLVRVEFDFGFSGWYMPARLLRAVPSLGVVVDGEASWEV